MIGVMRKIWPFTFYFFFFAAFSALMPYLVLYYRWCGLSGFQIGLLTGLTPIITTFSAPFWTGLADATRRHNLILRLNMAAAILVVLLMPAARTFLFLFPVILLHTVLFSPISSLADSATLTMLGKQREEYGRIRLGGTMGWGIVSAIAGVVIEQYGLTWSFWLYAINMTLAWLVSHRLTFGQARERVSIRRGIRALLTNHRWSIFLITVFIAGMGMSTVNTYLFPYMEEAGARKSLMGLAAVIATISEIPVFFFSKHLLQRLKSRGLLMLSMAVIGARLLLYFFFAFPAAILLVQIMHGLTFAALWTAGVSYAHENAPTGMAATAQGLFGSVMMGFGSGAGGMLGGLLIDHVGTAGMYGVMGIVVLLGLGMFVLLERLCRPCPQVEQTA